MTSTISAAGNEGRTSAAKFSAIKAKKKKKKKLRVQKRALALVP